MGRRALPGALHRAGVRVQGGQARASRGGGWYAAEEEYTCTGAEAWFYLRPPVSGPIVLELVAAAPHPDLAEHPLHLEVLRRGRLRRPRLLPHPLGDAPAASFPISAPSRGESRLRIDLKVDRTWRPDDLFRDGRDPRQIGLAVHRMALGSAAQAGQPGRRQGHPREASLQRLQDHLAFLEKAIADKDAFYARELAGKERLIGQLQENLERYHATPPFRAYFALKRLLRR